MCARSSRDYGDEEPLTFGLFGDRKTSNNASNISSNKFWKGACKPFDLLEKLCGSTPSERAIDPLRARQLTSCHTTSFQIGPK